MAFDQEHFEAFYFFFGGGGGGSTEEVRAKLKGEHSKF